MENIDHMKKKFKKALGRNEYIDFLSGKKLSPTKAILADCYECTGNYSDGKVDCESQHCPLYQFMPYRKDELKVKKVLSEKQQEAFNKMAFISSGTRKSSDHQQLVK
ncbi:MAG: hypothetical protein C0399_10355 [Syntrophus sp. (in: bacteria)]|nr:hypothetical protein [Syntrophus sp. (in: bacteria)]